MAEEGFKRKLTAILSADAVGYSRLMGDDEEATIRILTEYRETITSQVNQHNGRVVDSPGDNVLAEFASVVDAARCAVETQEQIAERNSDLPENRRMLFRIGVNLGDIVDEGNRIYGDGVNIAARLESLAEAGGICISGTAFDQVKGKMEVGYKYLGEQNVKNIKHPVRIYKMLLEPDAAGKIIGEKKSMLGKRKWAAVAVSAILILLAGAFTIWNFYLRPSAVELTSEEKAAAALPEKPSIAVLPFDNLSGDADQEYLADGITENIITALSKIPEMLVIARNSVFTYKDKPIKIQQVGQDLGVRFVLEGSIRKADNRLRVTGQLIDAATGHHLWADQYDRDLKDLFAVQDEITMHIASALQVELTDGEQAQVRHRSTNNLRAWAYGVKGYSFYERITKDDNAKARELFEKAIEIDSEYAWAWTMLGFTYFIDTRYGWQRPREESLKKVIEYGQKAVKLDDSIPDVYPLLASPHIWRKEHDEAIALAEKSIAIGPNNAENHAILGMYYRFAGRFEDSIRMTEKAIRLHPYYPDWYLYSLEYSHYYLGQHEKAIAIAKKHLALIESRGGTDTFWQHLILSQNYLRFGDMEKARWHALEGLRQNPEYTFKWEREGSMYKDPALIEQQIDDLRKAGLTCEGE
ncbi:MAG: adenylate/guanylate cyclase domain-containing protein [Desulfobacterales bacterium]|nr:adenylate/guanylate cyclase domain-containing protein [Desulfobacterales bacterium]